MSHGGIGYSKAAGFHGFSVRLGFSHSAAGADSFLRRWFRRSPCCEQVFGQVPHANDTGAERILQPRVDVRPFGCVVPKLGFKRGRPAFQWASLAVYLENARPPEPLFVGTSTNVLQEGIFTPVEAHHAGMPPPAG